MKKIISILLALSLMACFAVVFASAEETPFISGDVNRDGVVTSTDSLIALQHSVEKVTLQGDDFELGDVDFDNSIFSTDSLLILQYSIKSIENLPYLKNTVDTNSTFDTGAYTEDDSSDNSFKITTKNLKRGTIYHIPYNAVVTYRSFYANDVIRFLASLQGLINRDYGVTHTSLVYINYNSYDTTWLDYMKGFRKTFYGYKTVELGSIQEVFEAFASQIADAGFVLWDQNVPSTANVAQTICGVDGYIPLKYDTSDRSFYNLVMDAGIGEVKMSLVDMFTGTGTIPGTTIKSSGSIKCDPYLWALEKYMPRCSDSYLVYAPDGATSVADNPIATLSSISNNPLYSCLPSFDYFVARRAFFFDLSVDENDNPCDDPNQPFGTDFKTLHAILDARYERAQGDIGQMIGFVPWQVKYTRETPKSDSSFFTGNMGAVESEWKMVQIASCYNLATEADAHATEYMFNASAYYKYVIKLESFENTDSYPDPETEYFSNMKHYMCFYMGDYDCSAWLKTEGYNRWNDPSRGDLPLMWGFNPNLAMRFPVAFEYLYESRTDNDFFVAGDSGAGYVNPSALFQGKMGRTKPTGADKWREYCAYFYEKFDLNSTGFAINGVASWTADEAELYSTFSPNVVFYNVMNDETRLVRYNDTVFCYMLYDSLDIGNGIDQDSGYTLTQLAVRKMHQHINWKNTANGPFNFSGYRTVLFAPANISTLYEAFVEYETTIHSDNNISYYIVDPENFADLVLQSGQATQIEQ